MERAPWQQLGLSVEGRSPCNLTALGGAGETDIMTFLFLCALPDAPHWPNPTGNQRPRQPVETVYKDEAFRSECGAEGRGWAWRANGRYPAHANPTVEEKKAFLYSLRLRIWGPAN